LAASAASTAAARATRCRVGRASKPQHLAARDEGRESLTSIRSRHGGVGFRLPSPCGRDMA
jgi:hypothetical protein